MGFCNKLADFLYYFLLIGVQVSTTVCVFIVVAKNTTYGILIFGDTFSLPISIMIACFVIMLIATLGCCGARMKNSRMLQTYAAMVLLLLIAEIILGILILVYTDEVENIIMGGMDKVFNQYGGDYASLSKSIDSAQHYLKCCGVRNYTDWEDYTYEMTHPYSVADGCCRGEIATGCGTGVLALHDVEEMIFTRGCYSAIKEDVEGLAIGLGVIFIIVAIGQLVLVGLAWTIAKQYKQ